MEENYHISVIPEFLKNISLRLPVRRSQVANWGVRLLNIKKPFCGTFKGQPMEVHPFDYASRSAYFLGFYERETSAWALNFFRTKQPQVIIDVGAHFGYFIYLAISELKTASIHAFEPDPINRKWLTNNMNMVTTTNDVHIVPLAVSNKSGTVKFVASDPAKDNNLWSGINLNDKSSPLEVEVPSISLDSYCSKHNLQNVDLVIMDIEGAEGFAVDGMSEGIKNKVYKNILLEFHPEFLKGEHSTDRIIEKFIRAGYKAFHFQDVFKNNLHNDKTPSFYDVSWRDSYLKQVDSSIHLEGWEHMLFTSL